MKKKMLRFTGMKRAFSIVIILAVVFVACTKGGSSGDDNDGGPHPGPTVIDTIAPILTLNTPAMNQVFTSGNAITVSGRITDDLGLYRGHIRITNDANGNVLKLQEYDIHFVLGYDFNITYTPTVSVASDYTVTVFFEDHGYNNATKSVKIKVNP